MSRITANNGRMKLNTQSVREFASQIKKDNQDIDNEFELLKKNVNSLRRNWEGRVSDKTITEFDSISKIAFQRKQILENYSEFLIKSVSEGGEIIEEGNTKLTDAFK